MRLNTIILLGGLLVNVAGLCGAIVYGSHRIAATLESRLTRVETRVERLQKDVRRLTDFALQE